MLRRLRFALLLSVLAIGSPLCFAAAAAQAAGPPPLFAAKAAAAQPASAAAAKDGADNTSAIQAGENIGEILKGWGSALLLGVAGLMGLAALIKRDVAAGVTLLVVVVIVGGFIYAPDQVQGFIESVWSPIGG